MGKLEEYKVPNEVIKKQEESRKRKSIQQIKREIELKKNQYASISVNKEDRDR